MNTSVVVAFVVGLVVGFLAGFIIAMLSLQRTKDDDTSGVWKP